MKNELRIGNWVHSEVLDYEIVYFTRQGVVVKSRAHAIPFNELEPIPLTEEWLVRFGFKKTSFGMRLCDFHLEASSRVIKTNELRGFSYELEPDKNYIEIKHVHQLQNLYFALTGEELKLKKDRENA